MHHWIIFFTTVISPRSAIPKIPSGSLPDPLKVGSPKMHEIADRVRKAASVSTHVFFVAPPKIHSFFAPENDP